MHYLSALLPYAEGQALAEGERNALTQLFAHKLLCLQHEKLPLSAGGALEKVSL